MDTKYRAQVDLLLTVLPIVAKEKIFALKGGTAINLFASDMPRLSVDIDLTYVPVEDDRPTALDKISAALDRIETGIKAAVKNISITRIPEGQGEDVKLNCQAGFAHVKIEVNTTTRGTIFPVRHLQLAESVQEEFKKFAAIDVVSHAELYGGKICAALDRQHPRDLFDMFVFYQNEQITEVIKQGFIIFLLSHFRPMHELLAPHLSNQKETYQHQFIGMTTVSFSYDDYEKTRERLVKDIRQNLSEDDKKFLFSFNLGQPEWDLFPVKNVQHLPAVKWKLQNIEKLIISNKEKHATLHQQLIKAVS